MFSSPSPRTPQQLRRLLSLAAVAALVNAIIGVVLLADGKISAGVVVLLLCVVCSAVLLVTYSQAKKRSRL